jgi:predicted enzyme related to lactoylglutathione lyase
MREADMRGRLVGVMLFDSPDTRASADFYARVFGWAEEEAVEGSLGPVRRLAADGSGRLRQYILPKYPPAELGFFWRLIGGRALWEAFKGKVTLVVEVPDLAEAFEAVRGNGGTVFDLPAADPYWGESCTVMDPAGVFIMLVAERAGKTTA